MYFNSYNTHIIICVPSISNWILMLTKEQFLPLGILQQRVVRQPKYLHDAGKLFHLVLSREQRVARVKLCQDTAQWPHVNSHAVRETQDDLGRAVEAWLDVGVDPLVFVAAGSKINDFDRALALQPQQDILLRMGRYTVDVLKTFVYTEAHNPKTVLHSCTITIQIHLYPVMLLHMYSYNT